MILSCLAKPGRAALALHAALIVAAIFGCSRATAVHVSSLRPPALTERVAPPTIVFGFVGGIISHKDTVRSEYKLAERLRADYPVGVYVDTFENRRRADARKVIFNFLDTNLDGKLSEEERRGARIVLFGHSWGGSAAVRLAREMEGEHIPVLLTVQVDSVARVGQPDGVIPANVARAANFYQPDGPIRGRADIRAADPARTQILGNFRFNYRDHPVDCPQYPWYERVLISPHTQIACDPSVWSQVELLIREDLPSPVQK